MAFSWDLTGCCYNPLWLGVEAMPRHKHHKVRMSSPWLLCVSHWFNTMHLLPPTCLLAAQSKWILISPFSFGIFKEPEVILAARFTCQLHLLYVWALFKSRSIKRPSQEGIKELKLLTFALYQSLDGNQVQIPVFHGTINICVKKGV